MSGQDKGPLQTRIGYRFKDEALLETALTHASTWAKLPPGGRYSNERMEFLGDRVLGLVVAEELYRRFPDENEGLLARRFAALVSGDSLARVAEGLALGEHMTLSQGEADSGGRENPALLANACEALIAALYLDGGLEVANQFVLSRWDRLIDEVSEPPKDNKTRLQEWAQAKGLPLPVYDQVACEGPAHAPLFTVRVTVRGEAPAEAHGRSKREAQQAAAGELITRLERE